MLKIYVTGKYQDADNIHLIMKRLEDIGYSITYKWTSNMDRDEKSICAFLELRAVKNSDILIAIVQKQLPYKGLYAEIGAALILNIPVFLVGDGIDSCIFSSLCKKVSSLENLYNTLENSIFGETK